jgi:predicted nucleotidyltransferase
MTLAQLGSLERLAAEEFARRVRALLGERILRLAVVGSRARGQARADSDLDIWVLLDRCERQERRQILAAACDVQMDLCLPFGVSPLIMTRDQYNHLVSLERGLPRDLEKDAIPL